MPQIVEYMSRNAPCRTIAKLLIYCYSVLQPLGAFALSYDFPHGFAGKGVRDVLG